MYVCNPASAGLFLLELVFSLNGGARLHRGPGQHGGPGALRTGPSSVYWPLFSL